METIETRMATFALTFPCMKGKPGVKDALPAWDAEAVDQWAAGGVASHGERVTAQFLLAVWNPDHPWKAEKFDLMEALRVWDERHHAAFLRWAERPWWA